MVAEIARWQLAVEGPTGTYDDAARRDDRPQLLERGDHPRPAGDRQPERRADQDRGAAGTPRDASACVARACRRDGSRWPRTKGRSGTVWYDDAGNLVKAIVLTRGETLAYELAA